MTERNESNPKVMLDEPGVVESLVSEGRTPWITSIRTTNGEQLVAVVPPRGIQSGDTAMRHIGHIYEISSPTGERRGLTQQHPLTTQEAEQIVSRIDASTKKA